MKRSLPPITNSPPGRRSRLSCIEECGHHAPLQVPRCASFPCTEKLKRCPVPLLVHTSSPTARMSARALECSTTPGRIL